MTDHGWPHLREGICFCDCHECLNLHYCICQSCDPIACGSHGPKEAA